MADLHNEPVPSKPIATKNILQPKKKKRCEFGEEVCVLANE